MAMDLLKGANPSKRDWRCFFRQMFR